MHLECSTLGTLNIRYMFRYIISLCQIALADILLGTMTLSQFQAYNSLYLDGITFTYDPDKSNLKCNWECIQTNYYGSIKCDNIIHPSDIDESSVYIYFEDTEENNTISYDRQY